MDPKQKPVPGAANKMPEVSAAVAAQILGVSERTVLNFIRQKQIRAVKVGKSWFVQKDSVEAFKIQRSSAVLTERQVDEVGHKEILPERKTISSAPQKKAQDNLSESSPKAMGVSGRGIQSLNCYRLAVEIFAKKGWGAMASSETFFMGGMISKEVLVARAGSLQLQVLESLGAGYHSFGSSKVIHYGKARAAAGSLLALISAQESIRVSLDAERVALVEKLIPALVALQRTAEKIGKK